MIKILQYLIPVLAVTGISVFYMLLPDMRQKYLLDRDNKGRRLNCIACLAVTLTYAVAAFLNLGTANTPETFAQLSPQTCIKVKVEDRRVPDRLLVYSGINVGTCEIDLSEDGHIWTCVATLDQNYAELIRWREFDISDHWKGTAKYLRIRCREGNPRIGELALLSGDTLLTLQPTEDIASVRITDEQNTVPSDVNYLNSSYFDEIYHVRTAREHIDGLEPYEISHPPLGKLLIAFGIRIFGFNPFGWRFMGTLAGVLMVPLMYAFLHTMFGNTLVSSCGSLLLATDFMHFTQTRIATIDSFAVLFILLMYWLMYRYLTGEGERYLALSGLAFGLGAAAKWTCLYAGAGLGILWLLHWLRCLVELVRSENTEKSRRMSLFMDFLKNCGLCLVFFVAIPALIYYLSYIPYGVARGMSLPGMLFKKEYVRLVLENQEFMFSYHSGINATHPYSSKWYQWLFDIRPILYYLKYYDDGTKSGFGAFLNPVLCWGGLISILMLSFTAVKNRDKRAAFIVFSWLAQLLPWVFVRRIVFEYHYFACSVFLVLATSYIFAIMLKEKHGKYYVLGYTTLSLLLFILFYPAIAGTRVNAEAYSALVAWLPTWPF